MGSFFFPSEPVRRGSALILSIGAKILPYRLHGCVKEIVRFSFVGAELALTQLCLLILKVASIAAQRMGKKGEFWGYV